MPSALADTMGTMSEKHTAGASPSRTSPAAGTRHRVGLRAMVIEDEPELAALVGSYFARDGFDVTVSHDGGQAVTAAREIDPDVIVLDLGLPGLDGVEVCRQLRTFSDAYVVILTARSDEVDTLIGLSVGADDYMTKPFSPRELMARVQAMLRRPRPLRQRDDGGRQRTVGSLTIDTAGRDVWLEGDPVALTRTEFDLLAALAERPRMAFSRRRLIEHVWGETWWATSTWSASTSGTCVASSATTRPRTVRPHGPRRRLPDGNRPVTAATAAGVRARPREHAPAGSGPGSRVGCSWRRRWCWSPAL